MVYFRGSRSGSSAAVAAVRVAVGWVRGFQGGELRGAGARDSGPDPPGGWGGGGGGLGLGGRHLPAGSGGCKALWLLKRYVCVRNSGCPRRRTWERWLTSDVPFGTWSCMWEEVRAPVCPSRDSHVNNDSNNINNHLLGPNSSCYYARLCARLCSKPLAYLMRWNPCGNPARQVSQPRVTVEEAETQLGELTSSRLPPSGKLEESLIPEPVLLAAELNLFHFGNCVTGSSQGKWGEVYVYV